LTDDHCGGHHRAEGIDVSVESFVGRVRTASFAAGKNQDRFHVAIHSRKIQPIGIAKELPKGRAELIDEDRFANPEV
jgi:hypothetical protein